MTLDKYNHKEIEKKWQEKWFNSSIYHWNSEEPRENNYVIDTPPPTVSGLLHMGHIFSYTQADLIARYKRMTGYNVFYPIGFDDNGLPTEKLVEKTLNIRAKNMAREEFIEKCQQVVSDAEEEFRKLFKSVGLSFDWTQEYQTISKPSRKISQMSFIDLFNKNLVYRKPQPTLWDVTDQTALAQADIVDAEKKGIFYSIIFKTEEDKEIIIATTRPELIAANVAVFVNPNDDRYKNLIGKHIYNPLFEVKLPVIADDKVEIEKGTGIVMCSTFGDITDMNWWRTYNLPLRQIITKDGRIKTDINDYQNSSKNIENTKTYLSLLEGLKIKEAKDKMVELLKEKNLITKEEEIAQVVKCAERSGTPLEIIISEQWTVKVIDFKDQLLEKANECNWHPEYMKNRIETWITGLNWDWCISRQRYFGVPFPAWYSKRAGEEGKILIAEIDQLPVDPYVDLPKGYTRDEVEPDFDVMDTWATSSVTPQLASLAINKDLAVDYERHQKLFPADLRPQAHEIIRTWAFYTLVKALFHENSIPWENLMISGWCLAADKTKMSKSKGNVVTPVNLIEEKGSDVVRYWASTSRLGADIAYSEELFKIGNKLITKLWNATKFCTQYFSSITDKEKPLHDCIVDGDIYCTADLWMLSKLSEAVDEATTQMEQYEYSFARSAIEDFFWNVFCDNYLEIIKVRAYDPNNEDPKGKLSAALSLYHALPIILRLLAPFLPHVTEEIYSTLFDKENSIHTRGNWPDSDLLPTDYDAEEIMEYFLLVLNDVRKNKAEKNLSLKTPVNEIYLFSKEENINKRVNNTIKDLQNVSQAVKITFEETEGMISSEDNLFSYKVIL